ncbi:MAG TPA: hypothetical protein VN613_01350 [Gemmatimonadaceae bacterium]|nr:hypothetical protein [Gemmatimonadaceae bacterium]
MRFNRTGLIVACLIGIASTAHPQAARATPPASPAGIGAWDVLVVRRAAALLATPEQWDHADTTGDCPARAKTFSIICAIQTATDAAAASTAPPRASAIAGAIEGAVAPRADCRFHAINAQREGTCGLLFDELPIFTLSRAKAITSGTWRTDAQPTEVWAGTMADAGGPVMFEARQLVGVIAAKRYSSRLVGYNSDSTTTFANVREFFRALEDRVARNGAADLSRNFDSVEIELYAGGTGVVRTYAGWYPVSEVVSADSTLRFQVDTAHPVRPNALDRAILQRAALLFTSDSMWNRADNRKCPPSAKTLSIYCAIERASIEIAGGFHHRRPAQELVREIVDERTKGKSYNHRMMDYNNDPSTHLADVQSLLAEAIARIK